MMKKIATFLAAAALMLGMSAPAMAAFDNFELIRIVYNSAGTQEIYTDLGNINTIKSNPASVATTSFITGQVGNDAGTLFGSTALSNLNVAYIAFNVFNPNLAYISGGLTAPSAVDNTSWANAIGNFQAYLKGLTITNGNGIGNSGNPNSYASIFQGTGAGSLGGLVDPSQSIEANLASLASGGAVTQKLYYFADNSAGTGVLQSIDLTTTSTGTTTIAATPIPPSLLLMGSGLLGMVGIRRKFTA